MIKILAPILAAALSGLTIYLVGFDSALLYVAFFLVFFIGYMLIDALLFFGVATIFAIPVSRKKKPTKYSRFYHNIYTTYCKLGLSIFGFVLHTKGIEKVPKDTNFLAVQNHVSNFDPVVMNAWFGKYDMIFVSKNSLFKVPWFGKFIHKTGYISLTRKSILKDRAELEREKDWIARGECSVCVYPEGTRNKDYPNPILTPLKAGSFDFARQAQKPIVVTALKGTEQAKKHIILSTHHIYMEVLDVLYYDDYKGLTNVELADKVFAMMSNWLTNDDLKGYKRKTY